MNLLLPPLRAAMNLMPSAIPARQRRIAGTAATVDGIDYVMPVNSEPSPVLMAAFPTDARQAAALLPGEELHPFLMPNGRALLVVTVIDYLATDIGSYIEYSLAIAVTHTAGAAPPLLPLLLRNTFQLGQYVVDLPVSTEVSVKGGKGIWGMPKHQASLDFRVTEGSVSSAYELDGEPGCLIQIKRPPATRLPLKIGAVNFCSFRGMLYKSTIYFAGTADIALGRNAKARLTFGSLPQVAALAALDVSPSPIFTMYMPDSHGVLDDHTEQWFLFGKGEAPASGEGLQSVVNLGYGQEWPPAPNRASAELENQTS
ncbi:hypothetical protein GCM10027568_24890 [Humibacter soli]